MFLELLANIPKDSPSEVEIEGTKVQNLSGQTFGKLTALYPCQNLGKGRYKYYCICECGNYTIKEGSNLRRLMSTSCGCNRKGKGKTKDEKKSDPLIELICPVCGTTFYRKQSRIDKLANAPCCSRSCSRKNCKPRSWKPAVFRDLYGNFLFNQDDLDRLRESGNTLEKVLSVRCLECGDIFKISYSEYQDIVSRHDKGVLAGRFCSHKCHSKNMAAAEDIKQKRFDTNIEKYGGISSLVCDEVQTKVKQTLLEKYGVENVAYSEKITQKKKLAARKKYYQSFLKIIAKRQIECLSTKEHYYNNDTVQYRCLNCGHVWEDHSKPYYLWCPNCKRLQYSKVEKEVVNYIRSICDVEILENYRNKRLFSSRHELDIYIPSLNVAFEFNGNYYHSDLFRDRLYHQNKVKMCHEQQIDLVHIFEYEWSLFKEKVKLLINEKLGATDALNVYGCTIEQIDNRTYNRFIKHNHFKPACDRFEKYAVVHPKLGNVAVICFDSQTSTVVQYSVKLGYKCVKLFEQFIKYIDASSINVNFDCGKQYLLSSSITYTEPDYVLFHSDKVMFSSDECKVLCAQKMAEKEYLKIYDGGTAQVKYTR